MVGVGEDFEGTCRGITEALFQDLHERAKRNYE
jgi:hypothetical protein